VNLRGKLGLLRKHYFGQNVLPILVSLLADRNAVQVFSTKNCGLAFNPSDKNWLEIKIVVAVKNNILKLFWVLMININLVKEFYVKMFCQI
jgi:hypothetical protein